MIRRFLTKKLTRGEFVRSLGRYAVLGLLVLMAAWFIDRRRRAGRTGGLAECGLDLACRQCAELAGCEYQRAVATRKAIRSDES